jgi:membrane protein
MDDRLGVALILSGELRPLCATYGSLGAAIALMIWMWMSTIVVLFGAELNSEIEHQTAADSTSGPEKPLGSRGAEMADTLGASQ